MSSITRQPNKTVNEPNRRRSCSDSAIRIQCGFRQYPPVPDWAMPRSDYDIASCSSDDDHERIELDDRKGYRKARRRKLKVRRRWAQTIGLEVYKLPRFCGELTEHVRSVREGPLDADGIREDEGFFSTLTAPYEPPSRTTNIDWAKRCSPSPPTQKPNRNDSEVRHAGCPPGLCTCAAEEAVDNDHSSDDDEPIPDRDHEMKHDLYVPSGKWEKVRHSSIDGWETLRRIKGILAGKFALGGLLKL